MAWIDNADGSVCCTQAGKSEREIVWSSFLPILHLSCTQPVVKVKSFQINTQII